MRICDLCKKEKNRIYPIETAFSPIFKRVTGVEEAEICDECNDEARVFLREAQAEAVEVKFAKFEESLAKYYKKV